MPEITSAAVTGSNGRSAGYAYFNRRNGRYYGTGNERINRSERLGADGSPSSATAGSVRQSERSSGARQAARTANAFGTTRRRR